MGAMTIGSNPTLSLLDAAGGTASRLRAHADTSGAGGTSGAGSASATKQTSDAYSVDSIGSTFLSLLVQELQNQDPTSPMDSTQMVGQMISLNQLNELASMNQTLTRAYPSTSTAGASGTDGGAASGAQAASDPKAQAAPESRTEAALRLLQRGAVLTQPRVSTSVTLPAF